MNPESQSGWKEVQSLSFELSGFMGRNPVVVSSTAEIVDDFEYFLRIIFFDFGQKNAQKLMKKIQYYQRIPDIALTVHN